MRDRGVRWSHQYQRIADVVSQRAGQLEATESPIRRYARQVAAAAPPFSPEQRARLRVLLGTNPKETV
jgi:hypothetical protein